MRVRAVTTAVPRAFAVTFPSVSYTHLDFGVGVGVETVDRDNGAQTVNLLHILDVLFKIAHAPPQCVDIFPLDLRSGRAAVELQRLDRRDDHHEIGENARRAALDVEKLFRAEVRAEARLGHDHIRKGERGLTFNSRREY